MPFDFLAFHDLALVFHALALILGALAVFATLRARDAARDP